MDTDEEAAGRIAPPEGLASPGETDSVAATLSRRRQSRRQIARTAATVVCWALVAAFGAFAIMRVFGLERGWYLDTLVAFTPYVALLSVVSLAVIAVMRQWWSAGVAAAISVTLLALFVPRAFGGADPGPGPRLRVMSSNMDIGAADPTAIVSLVREHRIDVLAVEEYTPAAQRRLVAAGLETLLPYAATTPIPGATGSAIYSRYPLRDTGYRPLAGGFGQEYATVLVPGAQPLVLEAVHARAPGEPDFSADWATSLRQEPAATPKGPVRLLIGDFNSTLDHKLLRDLLGTGYRDVASQLGDGLEPTWPYEQWHAPPITLDHAFADPRIGAVSFGTSRVSGTDHKAIYATLTLPEA